MFFPALLARFDVPTDLPLLTKQMSNAVILTA